MRNAQRFLTILILLFVPAMADAETLWIPAAASNPGLHGTVWSTELWLYSGVGDETITVTATFFPEQGDPATPPQQTIELPPNAPIEIRDAVATLFAEHQPGAIRLDCDYPFRAQSRTVNSGGSTGVFGQGIPAYSRGVALAPGYTLLGASNRPGPDGVRTNIGIVNTGGNTQTVNIIARDPDTQEMIGTTSVESGPFEWYQTDLFDLLEVADQDIELADVSVFPAAFRFVYISRIDNRSGDGTFIYGSSGESILIDGNPDREFEVQTMLTYDDGVTVDWIKWPGPDGFVYTEDPESGYLTGTTFKHGPSEYCVDVVGRSGPSLSGVTVSIQLRPPGGDWSGGSTSYSTIGNSPIDQEFCKTIR